jgi:hypothetical protein
MIGFTFAIANPLKYQDFVNLYEREWSVSENKRVELQIYRYSYELFSVVLNLRWWGRSHAGPEFEINILGLNFRIGLVDRRHWDHSTNTWEQYDD